MSLLYTIPLSVISDELLIKARVGNPDADTLKSIAAKLGDLPRDLRTILGVRWDAAGDLGTDIGSIRNDQIEVEWSTTPVSQQVASVNPTNLTIGSVTPTFPTGSTRVRAILVAGVHAANQAANTHHISLKVQGQKAAGGYGDLIDLTAQPSIGLVNVDGASDGWVGSVDVTALVDTSAVQYDFRFVVDSDNAGAVNYTTAFMLVLIYRI